MGKKISTMTEAQAKEALTTLGTDLSGKFGRPDSPFGDFVASRNAYGPYFRRRVVPTDRKFPGQLAQRSAFSIVGKLWGTFLTKEARETWNNLRLRKTSRSGRKVTLAGQAAWMFINVMRQRIGLPILELPPTGKAAAGLTPPLSRLVAPATLLVTFHDDPWNAAGGGIIVSGSVPLPPGVTYWRTFNPVALLAHPGTAEQSIPYPNPVAPGDRVRLRFHASAPGGRQSMAILQDLVAD